MTTEQELTAEVIKEMQEQARRNFKANVANRIAAIQTTTANIAQLNKVLEQQQKEFRELKLDEPDLKKFLDGF